MQHAVAASACCALAWPLGGFERLHYLLEEFFDVDDQVNPAFIK